MPLPQSPRLRFDELQASDDAFILRLTNSDGWLRYIGDRGIRTLALARDYIESGPRALYSQWGYGLWRVRLLEDPAPLGICGFVRRDSLPGPDLGFAFLEEHCGRGFAREAANACLEWAHSNHGLSEMWAICQTDNARSLRLLHSLGFETLERMAGTDGTPLLKLYKRLCAPEPS